MVCNVPVLCSWIAVILPLSAGSRAAGATLPKGVGRIHCLSFYGIFIHCFSIHISADSLAIIYPDSAKAPESQERAAIGREPDLLRVRRAGLYPSDDRNGRVQLLCRIADVATAGTAAADTLRRHCRRRPGFALLLQICAVAGRRAERQLLAAPASAVVYDTGWNFILYIPDTLIHR